MADPGINWNAGTTTPSDPGINWNAASGIGGGIASLLYGKPDMSLAQQIAGQATQGTNSAIDRITAFLNDPSAITKMPGYQFGMDTGIEAVNRGAGASGLLNSGNRLLALQNFGQNYAGTWIDRMYNELMGNVNANVQGGNLELGAGQFLTNARQQQKQDLGGGITGLLSGIFGGGDQSAWNWLMRLIGGGSGGGGGGGGYPIGSPGNPAPSPGDPTPGGGGGVGGPGDPGGPMDNPPFVGPPDPAPWSPDPFAGP